MAKLRCPNCEKEFDKKTIVEYGSAGATGLRAGVGAGLPVWPFTLRVCAQCPVCKRTGWLRVLPPWSKS